MSPQQPTEQGAAPCCKGKRRDGAACRSVVVLASGWCGMHDPGRDAERAAQRRAGGRARSNVRRSLKALPVGLAAVLDLLLEALTETHSGKLPPAQASAMARLAAAVCQVYQLGELAERLQQLEAQLSLGSGR